MDNVQAFFAIFQPIWTVVVMIIFVGISIWAWRSDNKASFDEAAHLPFDDDNDLIPRDGKTSLKEK